MSNELSIVLKNTDLSAYKEDLSENENFSGGMFDSFPVIRTVGKEFILTVGGEPVGKPAKEILAVIVKANNHKSNRYFAGAYNPKEAKAPDCASSDDVRPDKNIEEPQSSLCANCPHHAFGGACRPYRRTVLGFIDQKYDTYNLYRLDVPAASLKSLKVYGDLLNQHKLPASAVVTKISMDDSVAYAKFNFECVSVLPVEVYRGLVKQAQQDPIVTAMLESSATVDDANKKPEGVIKQKAEQAKEVKKPTKKSPLEDVDFAAELDAAIVDRLE